MLNATNAASQDIIPHVFVHAELHLPSDPLCTSHAASLYHKFRVPASACLCEPIKVSFIASQCAAFASAVHSCASVTLGPAAACKHSTCHEGRIKDCIITKDFLCMQGWLLSAM